MSTKARAERGAHKSKKFPNLYKYPYRSKDWVYRRWSKKRGKQFIFATGEATNEREAARLGEEAYHRWNGERDPLMSGRFGEFADSILIKKLDRPDAEFSPNSKRRTRADYEMLISAFGRLRLDQITEERWEDYIAECSKERAQKFFNRRKALIEITRKAQREGLITRLPDFKNPDSEAEMDPYLENEQVERILACAAPATYLLAFIMIKQGPRPGEAIQYEWSMIRWGEPSRAQIAIPARISKNRRARTIPMDQSLAKALWSLKKASRSRFIFPSPTYIDRPIKDYKTGWNGACQRAGVHSNIYALRDKFVTDRLKEGKNLIFLAKYVDSSPQVLAKRYAHALMSELERIVE